MAKRGRYWRVRKPKQIVVINREMKDRLVREAQEMHQKYTRV